MAKTKKPASAIIEQELKTVPVSELKFHPSNPRQGDVGAIHESITKNGFYGVIIVQKSTGYVLAGNHRLQALLQAGEKEVPVAVVDVNDEAAKRIMLVDNRTNDLASYNDATLVELLESIAQTEDGFAGTGYDGDFLDQLIFDLNPDYDDVREIYTAMPEYEEGSAKAFKQLIVHFATEADYEKFQREVLKRELTDKTKYVWYPEETYLDGAKLLAVDEDFNADI